MAIIVESPNFTVETHPQPFVSRADGGHLRIISKDRSISESTDLNAELAIELMFLRMIAAEALRRALVKAGIPVVKINWEELGNWAWKRGDNNFLHIHIFGRAENAKHQIFPEAVQLPDRSSGFYDEFEALTDEDVEAIRTEIMDLLNEAPYNAGWPFEAKRIIG